MTNLHFQEMKANNILDEHLTKKDHLTKKIDLILLKRQKLFDLDFLPEWKINQTLISLEMQITWLQTCTKKSKKCNVYHVRYA